MSERDAPPSVAAEAWNAGTRAFRTSVTGEPRAPLCGMGICFECRLPVGGRENVRSCMLDAATETPATATTPAESAAPVGSAAGSTDPVGSAGQPSAPATDSAVLSADVVVVGAGPAGIAAASEAAALGKRVLLLDEAARPGGQIWRHRGHAALPAIAREWLGRLERSGAQFVGGATVFDVEAGDAVRVHLTRGASDGNATTPGRYVRVDATTLVLATGARERFVPFPGWTLPGVVGIGGAQALLKAGVRVAGERVVIAGTGPLILPVAAGLARAGADVALIAEQAGRARVLRFAAGLWRSPAKLIEAARYRSAFRGATWRWGAWISRADAVEGAADRVGNATITDGTRSWTVPCTLLCAGYGLVPSTELASLIGCEVQDGCVRVDRAQRTSASNVLCAGEPTGIAGVDSAICEGRIAGLAAAAERTSKGRIERLIRARDRLERFGERLDKAFALRPALRTVADESTIVCRCEDVTLGQLRQQRSGRQAKLLTRAGMGPCQGRVCGPILEFLYGWEAGTVREPILPVEVGALSE